jgi:ATP-dependent DNA helicase RecG
MVPARNRRIGEFLKELGLAEARLTGLRKVAAAMAANGSPAPRYDFDEHRTYFRATLPAHAEYAALTAVRDAADLRALGDAEAAHRLLESSWESNRASEALAAELIRSHAARADLDAARKVLDGFGEHASESALRDVAAVLSTVRRGAQG